VAAGKTRPGPSGPENKDNAQSGRQQEPRRKRKGGGPRLRPSIK